jgi:hypothetical protein
VRGRCLEAFNAQEGHVADGQRTARAWLVHITRVTKGQAAEHKAVQHLARQHPVLLAGLAEGPVLAKSVALQLAKWTRRIPGEYRDQAEEILVAPARAGAGLRSLAAICAEILSRTAPPCPGCPVGAAGRRGPAHPPAALPRRAAGGDALTVEMHRDLGYTQSCAASIFGLGRDGGLAWR